MLQIFYSGYSKFAAASAALLVRTSGVVWLSVPALSSWTKQTSQEIGAQN
jgi:hypothetical protein